LSYTWAPPLQQAVPGSFQGFAKKGFTKPDVKKGAFKGNPKATGKGGQAKKKQQKARGGGNVDADFSQYGGKTNKRDRGYDGRRKKKGKKATNLPPREIQLPETMSVKQLAEWMGMKGIQLVRMARSMGERGAELETEIGVETAELLVLECDMTPIRRIPKIADALPEEKPEDMSEFRPRRPVVTIMGHVDHGKTTLLDALRNASVAAGEAGGITQKIGAFTVTLKEMQQASLQEDGAEFASFFSGEAEEVVEEEVDEDAITAVTFIDTPGHEAFTSMRARGSQITDIIVLVVACDDGLRPQTIEVLNLVKKSAVPMVVAVSKIDKIPFIERHAALERVTNQLLEHEIVTEQAGGEVQIVPLSAHSKEGLQELTEILLLESEVMELRAHDEAVSTVPNAEDAAAKDLRPNAGAAVGASVGVSRPTGEAIVLEASVDKFLGKQMDTLMKWGRLEVGDFFVVGDEWGRVRGLTLSNGTVVDWLGPSEPARVVGLRSDGVPVAGDELLKVDSEERAREVCTLRRARKQLAAEIAAQQLHESGEAASSAITTDNIEKTRMRWENRRKSKRALDEARVQEWAKAKLRLGDEGFEPTEVPVLLKVELDGEVDPIRTVLGSIVQDEVKLKIIDTLVSCVVCALSVLCLCFVCALSVLCLCVVCALSVLCLCFVCALSVLCLCVVCALSVLCLCFVCAMSGWFLC
jgi:translation initiation factor IF-2